MLASWQCLRLWSLLVWTVATISTLRTGEAQSLFSIYDNVTILTSGNFSEYTIAEHADGEKLQMVQFYLRWCTDTAVYSTEFRQFIRMAQAKWSKWLDISTIDCTFNGDICHKYGNTHYPRLRMLPFAPSETDLGQDLLLTNDIVKNKYAYSTVFDIRAEFIRWLTNNLPGMTVPTDWNTFDAISAPTLSELLYQLQLEELPVFAVLETGWSILGRELILDFSSKADAVRIVRVNATASLLAHDFAHLQLPIFLSIPPKREQTTTGSIARIYSLNDISNISNYKALTNFIESQFNLVDQPPKDNLGSAHLGETVYSNQVFWADLHNALYYILNHEIPRRGVFDGPTTQILVNLLEVIEENLSFPSISYRNLIYKLKSWLSEQLLAGRPFSMKEYLFQLNRLHTGNSVLREPVPFQACANVENGNPGKPEREFPCSLWTLFHVLTVAEYRRSSPTLQPEIESTALVRIAEYVPLFLACGACGGHFKAMSANLRFELANRNSSVLWLWRGHNKVNARLKWGASDVPQLAKRQFPTYAECITCYRAIPNEAMMSHFADYYANFDEEAVLKYLINFYAPERIVPL